MKNLKITNVLQGYFDVKKWSPTGDRKSWETKNDTDSISFTVITEKRIKDCEEFAKEYVNRHDETRFATTFKIGKNAKWYCADNEQCERPRNVDLDGVEFKVRFAFVTLHGDPSKKEANGYWCNDVQFEKVETNPFKNLSMKDAIQVKSENVPTDDVSETDFLNEVNKTNEDGNTGLPY